MICHKDFQRMMLDAEIYVDRIADMRTTNMNAAMEAVRQSVIKKKGNESNITLIIKLHLPSCTGMKIAADFFGLTIIKDRK